MLAGSRVVRLGHHLTESTAPLTRQRQERRREQLRRSGYTPAAVYAEPEVDRHAESEHIAYLVRFYFDELRGRQREIFDLADLQGRPTAEIARMLGVKPVTVRATLLRARRAIRLRILTEHPELLEDYAP